MNAKTISEGVIAGMDVPADWRDSMQSPPGQGAQYTRKFVCNGNPQVHIAIHYCGYRLRAGLAAAFRTLIEKAPHDLLADERESIEEVVGNEMQPQYFSLNRLCSENLGGSTVLLVDGVWKASGLRNVHLYVATDEQADVIQEIWFAAPTAEYQKWEPLFKEIRGSIVFH